MSGGLTHCPISSSQNWGNVDQHQRDSFIFILIEERPKECPVVVQLSNAISVRALRQVEALIADHCPVVILRERHTTNVKITLNVIEDFITIVRNSETFSSIVISSSHSRRLVQTSRNSKLAERSRVVAH
jgi:hypothetical protein